MLAWLMIFSDLFDAVCLHNAYLFLAIDFFKCFFFLAKSWVIDTVFFLQIIILHHARCYYSVGIPSFMLTPFFMKGLCAIWRNST